MSLEFWLEGRHCLSKLHSKREIIPDGTRNSKTASSPNNMATKYGSESSVVVLHHSVASNESTNWHCSMFVYVYIVMTCHVIQFALPSAALQLHHERTSTSGKRHSLKTNSEWPNESCSTSTKKIIKADNKRYILVHLFT